MKFPGNNKRAMILTRVSNGSQDGNTSTPMQLREAKDYCNDNGLEVVKTVTLVESAFKRKRMKFREALAWALKNNVRHIVFHRFDREARNLTDNEVGEDLVRDDKVVLHYVLERKVFHVDTPPSDFLMRDMHSINSKHYSRELSRKVSMAMEEKAKDGWFPQTHPPLGYNHKRIKDENGVERRRGTTICTAHDPREVIQVQREFELRAASPTPSIDEIRKQVLAEGLVPPNKVRRYNRATLHRRLTNIFYDCRFMWNGVEHTGKHERIISSKLFWAVQETFGIKNPYRKTTGSIFGGGWLKCSDVKCGCNIIYDPITKVIKETGETKTFKYYHCTNGRKVHPTLKGMRISEEKILDQFTGAVREIDIQEDFRDQLLHALNHNQVATRNAILRDIESYKAASDSVRTKEDRAYDHFDSGMIDKETYNQQRKRLQLEQRHYTALMEEAQLKINDVSNEVVKSILQLATNAESLWKLRSPEEKRELLEQLLSNQTFDGVSVRYELIAPLKTLAEMKGNSKWRRG